MDRSPLTKAFVLSQMWGCFPFSLKRSRLTVHWGLLAYSLFIKLFFLPQPLINIFQASFIMSRTKTHTSTATAGFILLFIATSVSYVCYFLNLDKLQRVLKDFAAADACFRRLGMTPYLKLPLIFDHIVTILVISLPFLRVYITPRITWYMAYQLAYLIYIMSSLYMLVQPFVRLICNLTVRLRRTRLALYQACKITAYSGGYRRFSTVLQLHLLLCSTVKVVNDIYSRNLLFVVFITFFFITTYVYYSIRNAFNSYTVSIIQGIVACYYSTILWLVAIHCHRISVETREFNILLFSLMINDRTEKFANNKKLRLHIASKNEVVLTACGLFPLDHALVHSMIAAATTYLVMLIDYGD